MKSNEEQGILWSIWIWLVITSSHVICGVNFNSKDFLKSSIEHPKSSIVWADFRSSYEAQNLIHSRHWHEGRGRIVSSTQIRGSSRVDFSNLAKLSGLPAVGQAATLLRTSMKGSAHIHPMLRTFSLWSAARRPQECQQP